MRLPLAMMLLIVTALAAAQEDPLVRVSVSPESVAVGEAVQLTVTVLVPTWFARPPVYPDFELANAMTQLPPDSSYPTSERIGRDTWSGIIRKYRIYPLTGATYRMAGNTLGVSYANPGGEPVTSEVPVPEIVFRGTVPAGAEGLDPYVAGDRLSLSLRVSGDAGQLEPGDAVVLEYVAELDGLPALFLPPLAPALEFDGAAVYADRPDVSEGPPARRAEKVTVVFEAGGEFAVPALSIDYWNTTSRTVETATVEARTFNVVGPAPASVEADEPRASRWPITLAAAAAFVLAGIAIWYVSPPVGAWRRTRREAILASEPYAFGQLQKALSAGNSAAAYSALIDWTARLSPPMDSRSFARSHGDAELAALLEAFSNARYARGADVDLRRLASRIAAAREQYMAAKRVASAEALPPLNPESP